MNAQPLPPYVHGQMTVQKPEKKTFDLGIYTFHQIMKGELCVDEGKLSSGTILGVLHPLHTVDPSNIYVFVICKSSGQVFQILRKNLRFKNLT